MNEKPEVTDLPDNPTAHKKGCGTTACANYQCVSQKN